MRPRVSGGWRLVAFVAALLGALADVQAQTLDSFEPDPDDYVYAIAVQPDGKVLIGGQFSGLHDGQVIRQKIARLNADGSVDASFDPGASIGANADVRVILVQPDGKILVGGFGTANGRHVARLNANGSLDAAFNSAANGPVYALALQPDGRVVVGGAFSTLQGGASGPTSRVGIGRLNPDGSLDSSFNPGTNGSVRALLVQSDGRILVGGSFTSLGGGTRHNIGRLSAGGALDATFGPGAGSHPAPRVSVFAIQPDGKILVGGRFTTLGGGGPGTTLRNNLGRLESNGDLDLTFDPQLEPPILCDCESSSVESLLVLPNRTVLVGGTSVVDEDDGDPPSNLVRLETNGAVQFGFESFADGTVRALTAQPDGMIIAGGDFSWEDFDLRHSIVRMHVGTPTLTKLVSFNTVGPPSQGRAVALSADGNTAIVGGSGDNANAGAAWIWTRRVRIVGIIFPGTALVEWVAGQKLVGSNAVGSFVGQGSSVALSADGSTALVGGPGDDNSAGAVWVWVRNGDVWTEQAKLTAVGAQGPTPSFGGSVALSADGNTAIISATGDSGGGGAFVWTRSGSAWSQQGGKLVGSQAVGGSQGSSVDLSADGNTAIVSSNADANFSGAVWIWTRSGGVWSQQGPKLVGASSTPTGNQGVSVSLSADGNTALVGGNRDGNWIGAAWVWTRSGGQWTQQGLKLVGYGSAGAFIHQGWSVALSSDGNTAVVGGFGDDSFTGAAWVWTRRAGVWTQRGAKLVGPNAFGAAQQGDAVAISGDGGTILIGGGVDTENGGAVWVTATPSVVTQAATAVTGTDAVLNAAVATNAGTAVRTTSSFDYGLTANYGTSAWVPSLATPGITALPVSAAISGLTCGTLYHFRAVASGDMTAYGSDATFSTLACPPSITTLAATNVAAASATFNATVTPNGADTTLFFDYGLTTSYGTTLTFGSVGSGAVALTRSLDVLSLSCATTYHYRARAQHVGGSADGADQTLTTAPCAPSITAITPGSGQLSVAFAPGAHGGVALTNYRYSIDGGATWITRSPAATTSPLIITGLTNGITYQVQMRAVNAIGEGAPSLPSVPGTPAVPATVPGAPTILSVTPGNGQLAVAFNPGSNGGSAITNYEFSIDGGVTWTSRAPAATTSPLIVTGLTNGTTYLIQLRAVNAIGAGGASAPVSGTPSAPPSAPTITSITPGNGQLSVAFTAGATGGSTITNYEYSTNGGATWTPRSPAATTSPLVIVSLANGTTYQVQLRAVNATGAGTASIAVPGTPGTIAAPPTITGITTGDSQLAVSFVAGTDGGAPVTNYRYSTDGGATWLVRSPAATTSPLLVSGLINGTTYQVRLRAVNAVGEGAPSASVTAVPSTTPAAPSLTGITSGNSQFAVTFAPGHDGGSTITNYSYSIDNGATWAARSPAATTSPLVVTGLTNGTTYQLRLRARNGNGDGVPTAPAAATPATSIDEAGDAFDPGANGDVFTVAVQSDGRILVGGSFTMLGGGGTGATPRNNLGRLYPDGTVDATFDPGANIATGGFVTAVVVQPDGKILVGSGGVIPTTRRHIGRLHADGSRDATFDFISANDTVRAIALQADGKILVGGSFTTLSGAGTGPLMRNHLARINPDGTVDLTFNPGADGDITALAVQPDGRILVGGSFTAIGGGTATVTRHNIARLNSDGSVDTGFDPGAGTASSPIVRVLRVQADGKILVGGRFATLGGGGTGMTMRHNIGRLMSDGSVDPGFDPGLPPTEIPAAPSVVETILVLPGGKMLVGGLSAGMEYNDLLPRHLARLRADGSLDADFEPRADGRVSALAAQADGRILVGGQFTSIGGRVRNRLARLGAPAALVPIVPSAPFTDDPIVGGVTVLRAVHILELRSRINALRVRFGLAAVTWTDATLTGAPARAVHVQEMRDALLAAADAAFLQGRSVSRPVFADNPLAAAGPPIRAVHIQQLRTAVVALEQS